MRAIVRKAFGGTDQLAIIEVADPKPASGEVLIRVKAFGLNRAEIYMRRGLWGEVAAISGIECIGEVVRDPSHRLPAGQVVAAVMGGMGRSRNGSYAELVTAPASNIFALTSNLPWPELAAIPESYATAWCCLWQNLQLQAGGRLLIRGGTSALGQAAINLARQLPEVTLLATTRQPHQVSRLQALGCDQVLLESDSLHSQVRDLYPSGVDAVLDIIGNRTLLDSLHMAKKGGYVCNAGFLGGGDPIPFNPLSDMPSGVNLNFFGSFMLGSADYPLSAIPMQAIIEGSANGHYHNQPAAVFAFEQIASAQQLMESNQAGGKIVVQI
ncbi:zinc-binding dehydrogenase [Halioxenophilus sp. WMMB6]|uniref:zinc-binding dehydrogenase n=1 Tax=Halioxenophilus sp. WMMB6 TaxID=3073815 RepID=UPI00295E3FC6|nr:zinc-binding dehydrogenase [Halioxenophilus sp. WMMB6]